MAAKIAPEPAPPTPTAAAPVPALSAPEILSGYSFEAALNYLDGCVAAIGDAGRKIASMEIRDKSAAERLRQIDAELGPVTERLLDANSGDVSGAALKLDAATRGLLADSKETEILRGLIARNIASHRASIAESNAGIRGTIMELRRACQAEADLRMDAQCRPHYAQLLKDYAGHFYAQRDARAETMKWSEKTPLGWWHGHWRDYATPALSHAENLPIYARQMAAEVRAFLIGAPHPVHGTR